ncbi:MAG TPA: hypothetical protein VEV81_05535 [Pyrinomonadaceae bacterium]|nr:hypothetical protein [Pyrinomonadaceae bacterium]
MIAAFIILLPLATFGVRGAARPAAAAGDVSNIRQVDFKNFIYVRLAEGDEAKAIQLRRGTYESADGAQTFLMRVGYGDLTGDGEEEAVVILRGQATRTSRTLDEVFIYTLAKGMVVPVANFAGGKRGDYICCVNSPENSFRIENQYLVLDLAVALDGDPQCDPTRYYTIKYRWDGHRMAEVERSPLTPLPEHRREVG